MHNGGIFDLLVNINDIQSLNNAIDTPAGQAQGLSPTGLRGQFFQLPSTIAQPQIQAQAQAQAPITTDPNQLLLPTGGEFGGENGSSAPGIERTLATNFGLTPAGIDTAQQVISGFGIPNFGVPGVGLGRTFGNLGALNAAERALGQQETPLLGELLDIFPNVLTGRTSLRERAVSRGDEAARFFADPTASIRSGATQGRVNAAEIRSAQEASRAREINRINERRESTRIRDVANARAEEAQRAATANRAQQERAESERAAKAARDAANVAAEASLRDSSAQRAAREERELDEDIAAVDRGEFGGTGGDDDGTVICTELHRQGLMPDYIYRSDSAFGRKLDQDIIEGYHKLALPVVARMKTSMLFTKFVSKFALPWAYHIHYMETGEGASNWLGEVIYKLGIPLCRFIGKSFETNVKVRS